MELVEYKTYSSKERFLVDAPAELEKSGLVGYGTKFLVFRVGFDTTKNEEYGKYFNKVKSNFDAEFKDDPDVPEFPFVNTKEYDEKYFAILLKGEAVDGRYTGNYLFNSLEDIVRSYTESLSVTEYTDFILNEDDWK